ncbi:MAG: putative DNA binding domain-containing protein [Phycisphaerae bacterium]|nr:putative DNA binding domain-containing protein [Phycisphaerae bacterium]
MNDAELEPLLFDAESDRVERKESLSDAGKIRQAICAFANDMPDHQTAGVLFIGAKDDGSGAHLPITDELLRRLADMRSDGNILPLPSMTVGKRTIRGCEMAVVIVQPAYAPPVRYNGRIWIRVGPRRATASAEEERRLNEKRRSGDLPFDLHPVRAASIHDLNDILFQRDYLTAAVSPDILEQNQRTLEQQLTSVRFVSVEEPHYPTVVGLLAVGKSPADFVPGAYVQFLRIDGTGLADPIINQKELHGPILDLLRVLDEVLKANISTATDITSGPVELRHPDYPIVALQQLTRNAIMHRDYQTTNAPVRITWFKDRIEIQNPGGPFGQVTPQNFGTPGITDYRNYYLAEAMKTFGFVQRFGVGISLARKALQDNDNPELGFDVQGNHVLVTVRSRS